MSFAIGDDHPQTHRLNCRFANEKRSLLGENILIVALGNRGRAKVLGIGHWASGRSNKSQVDSFRGWRRNLRKPQRSISNYDTIENG